MSSNIARELQQVLKQRESELSLAQGEIEERNILLTKASSVISSLQNEFLSLKKENEQLRVESSKAYADNQNQLNQSEEAITLLEQRLSAATSSSKDHLTTIARLQSELSSLQKEREADSHASALKLKEKDKKVASLAEELEASLDHSASLEKTLKEHKDRLSRKDAELINASRGFKELESKARKLTDQTATLSSQLEEAREALLAQERIATSLGSNIDAAKIERALVEKEWSAKLEAEIGVKEEEIVTLKKQLRDMEVESRDKMEAMERDWVRRAQEVELHWEKRLRDGMAACELKFGEEAGEWEGRLRDLDRQWQARMTELDQVWEQRLGQERHTMDLERVQFENQRNAIKGEAEAKAEEEISRMKVALEKRAEAEREEYERQRESLERSLVEQMEESEKSWSRRLEDVDRAWTKKHDEMKQRWAGERAARDEDWALQRSEIESRHQAELEELREKLSKRLQEAEEEFRMNIDKARSSWLEEKSMMESSHLDMMEEMREKAERQRSQIESQHMRAQEEMEIKMTSITQKLLELTKRETSRDASRAELSRRLEEMQEAHAIESQRRTEQEDSLRSTLETYRDQLSERTRELDEVQRELRAAKMQASLAALRQPSAPPPPPPSVTTAPDSKPMLQPAKDSSRALAGASSLPFVDDSLEETLAASRAAKRMAEASLSKLNIPTPHTLAQSSYDLAANPDYYVPKRREEASLSGMLNPPPSAPPPPPLQSLAAPVDAVKENDEVKEHADGLEKALNHAQALILSQPLPPAASFTRHSSPPSYHLLSNDLKRDLDETRATIARLAASSLPPSSLHGLFSTPVKPQLNTTTTSLPLPPTSPPLFTPMPASKAYGATVKPPLNPNPLNPNPLPPNPFPLHPSAAPLDSSYYVIFPPSAPNSFRVKEAGTGSNVDFEAELNQLRSLREQIQAEAYGSSQEEKKAGPPPPQPSQPPQPPPNVSDQVNETLSAIRSKLQHSSVAAGRSASASSLHPSSIAETAAKIENSAALVLERARSPAHQRTPAPGFFASMPAPSPDESTRRQLAQRLDNIAKKLDL